jgi:hypothetical protein
MIRDTETILLEDKFYAQKYYISYSAMSKLMYSPYLFYKHYVLGQKDDEQSAGTLAGKVIHSLLLDADNFKEHFILLPGNLPSDNPKKIIEMVFQHHSTQEVQSETATLLDYKDYILSALVEMNLYQSLKTDEQRVAKISTPAHEEYFSFLIKKQGKDIVDIPTFEECSQIVELLKNHPEVTTLLGGTPDQESYQKINEYAVQIEEVEGLPFGLKGILDNMVMDVENKYVRINDLKKTSKTLSEFPETIEFYNYWLQAALYVIMVKHILKSNDFDPEEWNIEFNFIVVDKYKQIYPFKVSTTTMAQWIEKTNQWLSIAKWHYDTRRFDLPYALVDNRSIL